MIESYEELRHHVGHAIECVSYGDGEEINVECLDCNEVLISYTKPETAPNEQNQSQNNIEKDFWSGGFATRTPFPTGLI